MQLPYYLQAVLLSLLVHLENPLLHARRIPNGDVFVVVGMLDLRCEQGFPLTAEVEVCSTIHATDVNGSFVPAVVGYVHHLSVLHG